MVLWSVGPRSFGKLQQLTKRPKDQMTNRPKDQKTKGQKMFRTIIFYIALYTWFVLFTPVLFVTLIDRRACRWAVLTCVGGVMLIPRIICGIKWKISGYTPGTHIPGIIAAKHAAYLETGIIFRNVPNTFFIIKREAALIPVYGWALLRIGMISVNRKHGATNMRELALRCKQKIDDGWTLVIYPEGTRVLPGARPPLRRGLLFIAEATGLPIYPVGSDCAKFWPRRGILHSGTTTSTFEPPLPPDATLTEIGEAINRHSA
ncbi:MAG: 1-acyl-sn-glycerol-3-phosphate acyltransferase [Rickettsiales bacterium]|jgi:1-acyl-sn-glycerol-3-phosphate acyltransferase|nr:1-acyl-sn-glycerol-3-phosphate acyltransferase [Rickettsiales bacterium]